MRQRFDQTLYDFAMRWVGVHYSFGGSTHHGGIDCSGLVLVLLEAGGIVLSDRTAKGLFDHFYNFGTVGGYGFGSLAFYGSSVRDVSHVGFCLDDNRMIHAKGGGSKVKTMLDAEKASAFVTISPIKYRKDFLAVIRPVYPWREIV